MAIKSPATLIILAVFLCLMLSGPTGRPQQVEAEPQSGCTPITSVPHTITSSGVYCLTTDVTTSSYGISINADHVTLDLAGHTITGPTSATTTANGIQASDRTHLTLTDGTIVGFHYGIRLDDVKQGDVYDGGRHTITNMRIYGSGFRGIRVEESSNVVADNTISRIGGTTVYPDAFAMGIETIGGYATIERNRVSNIHGVGSGEGVGISASYWASGTVMRDNIIRNDGVTPQDSYDWPADGTKTYGIWGGGTADDTLMVVDNQVVGFWRGIVFPSMVKGLIAGNAVAGTETPYMAGAATMGSNTP